MPVRFTFHREHGLQIEADDDETELTEQQAMIVAVKQLASSMGSVAHAFWDFNEGFSAKEFYDSDYTPPDA